jgi:sodium pump decarboxylase gamma subunit
MKEKMKKSLLSLALVVCMVCLSCVTVFAAKDKVLTEDQVASYKSGAVKVIEQIAGLSDEEIQNYLDQDDDFVTAALTSWNNAKDELGAYVEVGDQTVTTDGNNVIINSDVTYENKTADVELIINSKTNTSESMAFNINYTMGEKMEQAGLNTLMGIGIVFLMLIFLSFLISQFKHISNLTEKKDSKSAAPAAPAPAPAPAAAEEEQEEELADDGELVAVIAAAIAAYEGSTSTDGFVVRSIKRSKTNKWKRA